jgi:hypothetical protein
VSPGPSRIVLLPSLRDDRKLSSVVAEVAPSGPVALITAGWQEWEDDDGGLRQALGAGVESLNLRLHMRGEQVWTEDPELAAGHRELQQKVRYLRRVYNFRLARAMEAWTRIQEARGDPEILGPEEASALGDVQRLDQHHRERLRELRGAFYERLDPLMREAVARQREQIAEELHRSGLVVITGGHVPVLLNRLRLFGLDRLFAGKVLIALGGGGMALGEQVVLFHDSPPWGPGHAEVGEVGPGLYPAVLPFPNPAVRLRLDDPSRVSRMARRFAPATCLLLEPGTRVDWDGGWSASEARRLGSEGAPEPLEAWTMRTEGAWPSRN